MSKSQKAKIDKIVDDIGRCFLTFGGGKDSFDNPLAHALKDKNLMFAAGVDVRTVVLFIERALNG